MQDEIRSALTPPLPAALVGRLLEHHGEMRTALLAGDWEKVLLRGGKFAEAVMKLIHQQRTGAIRGSITCAIPLGYHVRSLLSRRVIAAQLFGWR